MSTDEDPEHGLVVQGEVCQQVRTPNTDWLYGVKYVKQVRTRYMDWMYGGKYVNR